MLIAFVYVAGQKRAALVYGDDDFQRAVAAIAEAEIDVVVVVGHNGVVGIGHVGLVVIPAVGAGLGDGYVV